MSQPLPLSPQLPSLDSRLPVPRDRPADDGERSAQRHAFGRLLDRFAQTDRNQEPTKDPVAAPQDQRPRERCDTSDDSSRPSDDQTASDTQTSDPAAAPVATHAAHTAAEPAKPAPDAATAPGTPTPTAVAVAIPTIAPVASPAPAAPAEATPAIAAAAPAATATPAVAVPANAPANGLAAAAATLPAAAPAKPTAAAQAEPVVDAAMPAADAALSLEQAAQPMARPRRTTMATATATTATAAKAGTASAPAEKAAAEIGAPQSGRLAAPRADRDSSGTTAADQGLRQFRIVKTDATAAAVDATALAGAREDPAHAQSGADQVVASLTSIDSPSRSAALYHKVADAARPGADAPAPADQVAIRLLHAVADGKRAIQMHLHPAELGSIDVKMQWQGDKLTAQFTVDRPETLQILQREVPALERSLGQAGVNVDSGSLSFSLRQQQGNGKGSGDGFGQAVAGTAFGDGGELTAGDEPFGQVIRDGILSIRV